MNWNPILEQTISLKKIQRSFPSIIINYEKHYNILELEPYNIDTTNAISNKLTYYKSMIAIYKTKLYRAKMELILRHKL